MSDHEAPEPDDIDQAVSVEERPAPMPPSADPEVPEADALEQAQVEGFDEER